MVFHNSPKKYFIIAILLIAITVSFFAEKTLPGDFLYSTKIYVNEKIMGAISITDKRKAYFETDIASRRLGEVEKLDEKNKLTEKTIEYLRIRFDKNISVFNEISERIKEKDFTGSSSVLSYLESSLDAHYGFLKKIENKKEYGQKWRDLIESVNKKLVQISRERRNTEEVSFNKNIAEEKINMEESLKIAESKIDEVMKIIERKKNEKNNVFEAEEKLKEAIAHFAEGKAKLDIPAYADAFALFKRAEREAESAKTLASFIDT